jgi:N-acyl-D-aspartate/D-glutamate deacylase
MHDTVIRGATIVDGTGAPGFTGDIAIRDGLLVQVGGKAGAARQEIVADGALATPGFIDVHSHYDGQATWDDRMDPSFSNGITTSMMGMCGVGFAPARPRDRDLMIEVMEGVEAIPGVVLTEGVPWKWESFTEYLEFLAGRSFGLDLGVLAPHAPMRVFAMGERAVTHEAATADDLDVMRGLVRDAMAAGAWGISAGRIAEHIYGDDRRNVPGTFAEHEEFFALADAMAESGRGLFQIVPRGTAGTSSIAPATSREERAAEHSLFEDIVRRSGRPVHYLLQQFASDPTDWAMMLDRTRAANAAGLPITAHVASRGFGLISMLDAYHNFLARPSYREIEHLPQAARAAAMRDPTRRAAILADVDIPPEQAGKEAIYGSRMLKSLGGRGYLATPASQDHEPGDELLVEVLAAQRGVTVEELVYDHLAAGEGGNSVVHMLLNYANGNLDHVHAMLRHPDTVSSLGDGGAHMKLISDTSMLPLHLSFWARDRQRGPRFTVEEMVARITARNADAFGLTDRGILREGLRADVNVIDFAKLTVGHPTIARDLPAGGTRLNQATTGFVATLLAGTITRRGDEDTGARPGRLLRAA